MVSDAEYDALIAKVIRAKKHILDLKAVCKSFLESNPPTIERQRNAQTRDLVLYFRKVHPVPPEISLIAGDALFNLRCALDHTAWHFDSSRGPQTYFPILDTAAKYQATRSGGKIQSLGHHVLSALDEIKPYQGGNDALWKLQKLNNIDKHRLVLAVSFVSLARNETTKEWEKSRDDWSREQPGVPFPISENHRRFIPLVRYPSALKTGDEITIPDTEPYDNPQLLIEIAVDEVGVAACEPLSPLLEGISVSVLSAITKICK